MPKLRQNISGLQYKNALCELHYATRACGYQPDFASMQPQEMTFT